MGNRSVHTPERFELSLGGFQIAAIVMGALVALVTVFFLGVHTGERLGLRRAEAAHPVSLPELDAVAAAQKPVPAGEVTFAAELPKAKPPAAPPPTPPKPPKPAAESSPPAASTPPAAPEPSPPPAQPAPKPPAWTVQIGASQNRVEAEELAKKLQRLGARIEEADIPGKGHYFRVRLGRFQDRAAADKYRGDVARETGLSGVLVPPGG